MLKLAHIARDYREAGSVNGLLALWGFVDEWTFLTKAGHVGMVYAVSGVDYEGLDEAQGRSLTHHFEAGLRLSDHGAATVLEAELDRAIDSLHQKAQAFEVQLAELGLKRLQKAGAFRFFRQLVNYDPDT